MDFLDKNGNMSAEDMAILFETVMLSYFSHTDETVEKEVYDRINDSTESIVEFEMAYSEIILEAVDQVGRIARHHFPSFGRRSGSSFLKGFMIADALQITDVTVQPNGIVLIHLPLHHYQRLQNEINACSLPN